jgi:hypothetical protein
MSDKQLIIELPEELIAQATAAHIDFRAVVEKAILTELNRLPASTEQAQWGALSLTVEEKEARLQQLLPPERLDEGLRLLREGKPIPGLMGGKAWMREDFDAPLPDEVWALCLVS